MFSLLVSPGAFRLALALAVFGSHVSRLTIGTAAVLTFFILSGYWIAEMWRGRYIETVSPYITFIVSRAWRLFPVFLVCSAFACAVAVHKFGWPDLPNIIMLGYQSMSFQPNVPAWSLDIELQFYILAPALVYLMARSQWALAGCAVFSAFAYAVGDLHTVAPYLFYFAIGIWASVSNLTVSRRVALASLSITLLVGGAILLSPYAGILLHGRNPGPLSIYNGQTQVVLVLLLAPWALHTVKQKESRLSSCFGDLSFLVYLIHWSILRLIDTGTGSMIHRAAMNVLALAVILGASYVLWLFIDRPVNKMRSTWVRQRQTVQA